jgi:hypothetical protein
LKQEGPNYVIEKETVHEHLVKINRVAGVLRLWAAVRYCSSLLNQLVGKHYKYYICYGLLLCAACK